MDPETPITPPSAAIQEPVIARPKGPSSTSELFIFFTFLGLQGFGGLVGVAQRELVDRKGWLTIEEFSDDWALAQALPGPNVVNLVLMYGDRRFGLGGAIISVAGLLGAPLVLLLAVAFVVANFLELEFVQGALRGVAAVTAALIAGSALKMVPTLGNNAILSVGSNISAGLPSGPLSWWPRAVGLLAALLGILFPSATIACFAGRWLHRRRSHPNVRAFTNGMAPIVIALLFATAWLMVKSPAAPRNQAIVYALASISTVIVWRTRIHTLWPMAAGALIGASCLT